MLRAPGFQDPILRPGWRGVAPRGPSLGFGPWTALALLPRALSSGPHTQLCVIFFKHPMLVSAKGCTAPGPLPFSLS